MRDEFIEEKGGKLPVMLDCDLLVCGGGVAGVASALAAARNGVKNVCLIEKGYALGGLATLGLIAIFLPLCDGNGHQVIGGIPEEFFHLAIKYGPGKIPDCWKEGGSMEERVENRLSAEFNPAWFMMAIEKLLLDAGVKIVYDTRLCSCVMEGGNIKAVIVENKSGRQAITCKMAIDATGDADLCHFAGEKTISLDSNRRAAWFYSYNGSKINLHILGDIFFEPVPEGSRTFSGDNWEDISLFCIDSRDQIMNKFLELRKTPGNENLVPMVMPSIPQFRKTRRLSGVYEISEADENRYIEDAVGMTGYYRKRGLILYYPYRSLYGKTKNLYAAGRCISSKEEFAWNISRGIPSCTITGQAAGTAAALCLKTGSNVQNLNVKALQETLMSQGVIIDKSFGS